MGFSTSRDFRGSIVTAIGRLLGASAAAAVLLLGVTAYAQDAAKKPVKAKSACNALTEETACKANDACRWVAAIMDAKTGKQKRKAYCRTQAKKKSTEPAKK
jgi:hypothetical protein